MDFTGAWSSPFQLPFAELSTHADGRVTRVTLVADVDAQHFDHVLPYLDLLDDLVAGSGTRALEMIRTGEEGSHLDLDEGQAQLTVWPHFLGGTEITLSDISWLPEPTNLPTLMKLPGETLTMSRGGNDVLRVVVSQVRFLSIYPDTTGGIPDEPGPGNIYVEAFVEYEALDTGMSFGSSEWQVYLGEEQIADHPTSVSNGPEPELQSGDLPDGKTASGWVVYEVPASGRLTLGYLPMWVSFTEPVGEWLLRE